MHIASIGIALDKTTFHLVTLGEHPARLYFAGSSPVRSYWPIPSTCRHH